MSQPDLTAAAELEALLARYDYGAMPPGIAARVAALRHVIREASGMIERPILFSPAMIRAICSGSKSVTRRVLTPQPEVGVSGAQSSGNDMVFGAVDLPLGLDSGVLTKLPRPGDQLWVREAFIGAKIYDGVPPGRWGSGPIHFPADGEPNRKTWPPLSDRARPSIHMPRWASRMTLAVVAVKIERLQNISEEEALAEGVQATAFWQEGLSARICFTRLWGSINGKRRGCAWKENPWVTAISFTILK